MAIAFTGYPAIAVDEVDAIRDGSVVTGVVSALLVMLLFTLGFRSRGGVLLAGIPLGIGMAWAFGMIVLTVGELNLLTQAAAPVFAGLGIDFAVHLLAAYRRARTSGRSHQDAMRDALNGPGRGILTGALTTSLAFLALTVTEYDAFRQLGLVSGLGLLLVMLAILFVTPALATIGERHGWAWLRVGGTDRAESRAGEAFARMATARPWTALALATAGTAVVLLGIPRIRFDANVEALLPADAESVIAVRRMVSGSAFSNELMASEADDLPALRSLAARMEALPHVGRVESIASLLPSHQDEARAILRDARLEIGGSRTNDPLSTAHDAGGARGDDAPNGGLDGANDVRRAAPYATSSTGPAGTRTAGRRAGSKAIRVAPLVIPGSGGIRSGRCRSGRGSGYGGEPRGGRKGQSGPGAGGAAPRNRSSQRGDAAGGSDRHGRRAARGVPSGRAGAASAPDAEDSDERVAAFDEALAVQLDSLRARIVSARDAAPDHRDEPAGDAARATGP